MSLELELQQLTEQVGTLNLTLLRLAGLLDRSAERAEFAQDRQVVPGWREEIVATFAEKIHAPTHVAPPLETVPDHPGAERPDRAVEPAPAAVAPDLVAPAAPAGQIEPAGPAERPLEWLTVKRVALEVVKRKDLGRAKMDEITHGLGHKAFVALEGHPETWAAIVDACNKALAEAT